MEEASKLQGQVQTIIGLGVEKVGIVVPLIADPELVSSAAELVGTQSIVVAFWT